MIIFLFFSIFELYGQAKPEFRHTAYKLPILWELEVHGIKIVRGDIMQSELEALYESMAHRVMKLRIAQYMVDKLYADQERLNTKKIRDAIFGIFEGAVEKIMDIPFYQIIFNEDEFAIILQKKMMMINSEDAPTKMKLANEITQQILKVRSHTECSYCSDPSPETIFRCPCCSCLFCSEQCLQAEIQHAQSEGIALKKAYQKVTNIVIKMQLAYGLVLNEISRSHKLFDKDNIPKFIDSGSSIAFFILSVIDILAMKYYSELLKSNMEQMESKISELAQANDHQTRIVCIKFLRDMILGVRPEAECIACGNPAPGQLFWCPCQRVSFCSKECFISDVQHKKACEALHDLDHLLICGKETLAALDQEEHSSEGGAGAGPA